MKKAKPRPLRLQHAKRYRFAWVEVLSDRYVASMQSRFWDPDDARRLATWLLKFADWAESREKTK